MALLPYLGESQDTSDWSQLQTLSYGILTYVIIFMFIVALLVAKMNIIAFSKSAKKMSDHECPHPLLFFYVWIILDLMANIVWLIFNVKASDQEYAYPLVMFMPATFHAGLGIEQIWLMIELIARINRSFKILEGTADMLSVQVQK